MLRGQALDLRGKIKPLVLQGREETGRKDVGEVREEHEKIQKKERMAQRRRQCPIHPADQCFASIAPISCCSPLLGFWALPPFPLLSAFFHPTSLPYSQHFLHHQDRLGTIPSSGSTPILKENRRSPRGCVDSACRSA